MSRTHNRIACAAGIALCAGTANAQTGACCLMDGNCSVLTAAACAMQNGVYRGDNTSCAAANCPQPLPRLWLSQFGTTNSDYAYTVTADGAGGCFVGGSTMDDAYLARFDRHGRQLWFRQSGTNRRDNWQGAASDGAGGVYVAGGYDTGQISVMISQALGRLSRYDGNGNVIWERSVAPGLLTAKDPTSVAADGSGGAFVAGSTNVGGFAARDDAFLCRYNSSGTALWARIISSPGGINDDWARAVASDAAGGTFIAGSTQGNLMGTNLGMFDGFLARYDGAGNQLWIRQFGTVDSDAASGLAPMNTSVLVCGGTYGTLYATNRGGSDAFLILFDSAGNVVWGRQFGTAADDRLLSVTLSSTGQIIATGTTRGSLVGQNTGWDDVFICAFDTSGTPLWINQFGSTDFDSATSAAPDANGGVYVSGSTTGALGPPVPIGSYDAFIARYGPPCYVNCDSSTTTPILNVNDYTCFLNLFAAGSSTANCDQSTIAPVLNVGDFTCFTNRYAAGCP